MDGEARTQLVRRDAQTVYNSAVSNFGFFRTFFLVDARPLAEFSKSHIKGAIHMGHGDDAGAHASGGQK